MTIGPVRQLRVCVTAPDHAAAVRFYRDVLGMPEDDSTAATQAATAAGAELLAPPTRTPWDSVNARLAGPAGLQLTIFHELGEG
jgi:catechol 2,3-dioxygenase-like lactoylglutathione lyase family enzyme